DLREIITSTATDVAEDGVDHQTGHGLINCYRAVKEVLRRRARRHGEPTGPFTGREAGDELDIEGLKERLKIEAVVVGRVGPQGQAQALGVEVGDVIASYHGVEIASRAQLRERIQAAQEEGVEDVTMTLRRGEETIEIQLKPGRIGIGAEERYSEPAFE
ncbi:MAG: hypothetical protein ACYTG6_16155, partial [Planctomycetota bacterium]